MKTTEKLTGTGATNQARVMQEFISYKNHFLIATPSLRDPNFFHSVTFVIEHTLEGAMGIVINHPLNISLFDVFEHMGISSSPHEYAATAVYAGGPMQPERGFVLHRPFGKWQSSLAITEDLSITTSRDVLEAIAAKRGPQVFLVSLGFAGWEKGQLEQELSSNAWLLTPASPEIIFSTPTELKWQVAAQRLLGVNILQMSSMIGHA